MLAAKTLFLSFDARCKLFGFRNGSFCRALHSNMSPSVFFSLSAGKKQISLSPNIRYRVCSITCGHIVHSKRFVRALMKVGTFFPSFLRDLVLQSERRATSWITRAWSEITLRIMRSAIFPRIHERWKSSRDEGGKERERVREWWLYTMRLRRRSNPSTCHLRPVCSGWSLAFSLSPLRHPPSCHLATSTFAPTLLFVRLFSSEAFQSRNSSMSSTSMTMTKNRKDELTFHLCKILNDMKVLATRSSAISKDGFIHTAYVFTRKKLCLIM